MIDLFESVVVQIAVVVVVQIAVEIIVVADYFEVVPILVVHNSLHSFYQQMLN